MENISFDINGLVLMLVLGLRHGLDPDHIAVIDGMTLRHYKDRPALAQWAGTLFALGHGLVVTFIAVIVATLSRHVSFPDWLNTVAEWLPVAFLMLVGIINLRNLLRPTHGHTIQGWRSYFLPKKLRETAHPWGIVLIGALFALVFDTTTQAAAWGLAAASSHGVGGALFIGLVFSVGMIATDTLDSRLLTALLHKTDGKKTMQQYRRFLGWLIVVMAFSVAFYSILTHFKPDLELSETAYTLTGLGFFTLVLSIYVWLWWRNRVYKMI